VRPPPFSLPALLTGAHFTGLTRWTERSSSGSSVLSPLYLKLMWCRRLKKVQSKKKRDKAIRELEDAAKLAIEEAAEAAAGLGGQRKQKGKEQNMMKDKDEDGEPHASVPDNRTNNSHSFAVIF
jgi:hypothetical protein